MIVGRPSHVFKRGKPVVRYCYEYQIWFWVIEIDRIDRIEPSDRPGPKPAPKLAPKSRRAALFWLQVVFVLNLVNMVVCARGQDGLGAIVSGAGCGLAAWFLKRVWKNAKTQL